MYFCFSAVEIIDLFNEIKTLNSHRASHDTDIPVKLMKKNADFFGLYWHTFK